MARIAGVDIPREKRLEISLTYIFGIGRTTAQADLRRHRHRRRHPGPRPHRRRGRPHPRLHRRNLKVEGDLRRDVAAGHQAQDGDRLLPGPAPPPRPPGPRPAHPDQRPHPQGPEEDRRRQEEGHEVMAKPSRGGRRPRKQRAQERHLRRGAHQELVQQHDRHHHRPGGQRPRLGLGRQRRLQGLPQVARRSPPRWRPRQCARRAMEHGVRKVDVLVKGPGSGRETAIRSLQNAGIEVTGIKDVTPVPHNGCRPPKRRRV